MANLYSQYTYDALLSLKAAGALTASTDGTILDLGSGLIDGNIVIDLTNCKVSATDEKYTISLEMSNVAAMTSGSSASVTKVFGNLVDPMDAALSAAGRYVIPFRNEEGGTIFRYVRLRTVIAGTSPTISYTAFVAKEQ